jgi:hypothetical protein
MGPPVSEKLANTCNKVKDGPENGAKHRHNDSLLLESQDDIDSNCKVHVNQKRRKLKVSESNHSCSPLQDLFAAFSDASFFSQTRPHLAQKLNLKYLRNGIQ